MFLVFDTETTGLPKSWKAPVTDIDNWPRMVQLAWQCHDIDGKFLFAKNHVIKPNGFVIPREVIDVHGISNEIANQKGVPVETALADFVADVKKSRLIVGHNIEFDIAIVGAELIRAGMDEIMTTAPQLCTKNESTNFCAIVNKKGTYKWPTLTELHLKLFGVPFKEAHNAAADVEATTRCFLELVRLKVLSPAILNITDTQLNAFVAANPAQIQPAGVEYESFKTSSYQSFSITDEEQRIKEASKNPAKSPFVHLHVHSQYSILDGALPTAVMAKKAKDDGMPAVAITDHGVMYGVKEFHEQCLKTGIKPIIGIEAYVAANGIKARDEKRYHLILLAKNLTGYKNLLKLTSISFIDGYYYKPRIDKELIEKYSEGLIACSACIGGEIAKNIDNGNVEAAEEAALWYKNIFGDDYYLEIIRHPTNEPQQRANVWEKQLLINKVIVDLSLKLGIKIIATNDVHFADAEDAEAHDLLVCLSTQREYDDPTRLKYTGQEWFKTTAEMNQLFADLPQALENTIEIANKVEQYKLDKQPVMPKFSIPEQFGTFESYAQKFTQQNLIDEFGEAAFNRIGSYEKALQIKLEADYLEHLTYIGAQKRYGNNLNDEIKERIDFELNTIKTMGFPGYFLIVQDFIAAAREMGVLVGPGRGSAAGAAVSYCVGITNIDPIKYNLLFERFLNPDRISMPDVDIDFDDDGRAMVLEWVQKKYGHNKVAHIVTFGTMAAKSSIKDVARVLKLELSESLRLAKMVPEAPKITLAKAFAENPELEAEKQSANKLIVKTLTNAFKLEGSVRQIGVHACGILISRDPLDEFLPVMPSKDDNLLLTQYDGHFVENIGLLKMDFLGLKTLSIFKETIDNIKLSKNFSIDIDNIPIDDKLTYELFMKGETTAIFQFESPGMKKHLQNLKPDRFEDLVAMNALYRPGPMEYIPSFIARKHGVEKVEYDHPLMETYLKDTYGITVYQEQVMLQSRALAGFTRGDSDALRKAMGKKIAKMMEELKAKFISGCKANPQFIDNIPQGKNVDNLIDKIWKDWEAFASYAFNKSHSVCYAYVAYQTGYLKAHYPAEFMAANLSRNLSNITEVTKLMEECKRMGIKVFGPHLNYSHKKFTVDKNGDIRFGLAAIKNVGEAAVENIIDERDKNGPFLSLFNFIERVDLRTCNRKTLESLAMAGAFDDFDGIGHRAVFFEPNEYGETFVEALLKYGNSFKNDQNANQNTLFGNAEHKIEIAKPTIPITAEWGLLETLNKEKELVGIYLSAHPLDEYKIELEHFCNTKCNDLNDLTNMNGREVTIGGIVTDVRSSLTKKGDPFGGFTIEDFSGSYKVLMFGKDYVDYKNFCTIGYTLYVRGKVQERAWSKGPVKEIEFKVLSIQMLSDVRQKLLKTISIKIPITNIDAVVIDELQTIFEKNKGKTTLKFVVYEPEKRIWVQMLSRKYQVNVTNQLIEYFDINPQYEYKLE